MGPVVPDGVQPAAPDRPARAGRLARARRRSAIFGSLTGLVVTALLWYAGLAPAAWAGISDALGRGWPAVLLYVGLLLVTLDLVGLPFGWYRGFRLAHRFGLSRQTLGDWLADWLKAAGLGLLFSGVGLLAFYAAVWLAGQSWWWLLGGGATLLIVLITFVAPYLILPIFYRVQPLQSAEVVGAVKDLARAAGTEVRDVCQLDFSRKTVEANAAVIGFGRSRKVVLADTLLEQFSPDEIRAVVAHELGHHVRRDVLSLLLIQVGVLWLALALAAWQAESVLARLGASSGLADPGNLPLLLVAAQIFGFLLAVPLNALSRRIEGRADAFALHLTGAPAAFASAMRKLASQNLAEESPPRWAVLLFATHPPIRQRIRRAEAFGHAAAG